METALRRIADMIEAFMDAAAAWFATGAWRPEAWPGITWALVAVLVVLSWLLAWRRRTPRTLDARPPQLLVTSGEVVPDGADPPASRPSGRRRRRATPVAHAAAGAYAMTVSNLSRYPVQLVEVALRDGRRGAPRVAIVDAVVPAMGSASVSGRILLGLRGDGWLDLYCYAGAPRFKMYRHRVELVWEPWAARFKAAPLDQVSAPTRRLASDEPEARFLEDDAVEAAEPVAVAAALTPLPVERRGRAPRAPGSAAPMDDRPMAASAVEPPASAPIVPTPVAPVTPAAPVPAAVPAPGPPASSAVPRPKAAHATRPSAERPASTEPAARGVPRIATPPVGVAVAGRGGEAGRTAGGVPIGRPTARPEPTPVAAIEPPRDAVAAAAPERLRGPASDAPPPRPTQPTQPTRTVAVAPTEAANEDDDPPRPQPLARRRPRLEFPDEF